MTDGILDQLAKYERAKIAERTRRGKLQKARQGKIIATMKPPYGFRYNEARDALVDPRAREAGGGADIPARRRWVRHKGHPDEALPRGRTLSDRQRGVAQAGAKEDGLERHLQAAHLRGDSGVGARAGGRLPKKERATGYAGGTAPRRRRARSPSLHETGKDTTAGRSHLPRETRRVDSNPGPGLPSARARGES